MEIPDTTVRVLYDFEYTTKDGRQIKINHGERLFLIKKTNNDWWQVIRSFERRPFYVPASYVEEVQRNKIASSSSDVGSFKLKKNITISNLNAELNNFLQHQSLQHLKGAAEDISQNIDKAYRNRSFSLEDKRSYSGKDKINSNKTHFSTMSSSGYESLSEVGLPPSSQTDVDYVNLRKDGDGYVIEECETGSTNMETKPGVAIITDKGSSLSNIDNSIQGTISNELNKIDKDNNISRNYSNISCISDNVRKQSVNSETSSISKLPLSSSLEELAQQIELKTNKLRKCPDFTKIFNSSENCLVQGRGDEEGEVTKTMSGSSVSNSNNVAAKVENLNKSKEPNLFGISRKLQYVGSFKTKLERQKWAKQHFDQSILKNVVEDDLSKHVPSVNLEDLSKNVTSIDINYNNEQELATATIVETPLKIEENIQKEGNHLVHIKKDKCIKDDTISKQKNGSRQSLDSIIEDEGISSFQSNSEHFEVTTGSRSEELPSSVSINRNTSSRRSESAQSEKGSTDSLLDIDKHYSRRKISGGTTSDGDDLLDNSDSEADSIILGMTRLKNSADDVRKNQKRKVSLTRNRRVDSCKTRHYPMQAPPSPTPSQIPTRTLPEGWNEYITEDGRKYFFNCQTKEKSWKPPRRRYNSNEDKPDENGSTGNLYSGSSSPLAEVDVLSPSFPLPPGWHTEIDQETGLLCYIGITSGSKWFSSSDQEGRLYFFEENSNESSWTLPEATPLNNNKDHEEQQKESTSSQQPPPLPFKVRNLNRAAKSRSMVITNRSDDPALHFPVPANWPQLWDGHMNVLREGTLNKTKITENGKRIRKNWAAAHVVLTELFLLFFKDSKSFAAMKSSGSRPELCIDLNGTLIDRGEKVSSRKNVYMLSTVLGLQVLIQNDDHSVAEQWLAAITHTIKKLPSGFDNNRGFHAGRDANALEEPKKGSKIGRTKSVKLKHKDESMEDLSVSPTDRQIKIKERLKKFFHRRPTMESLVKKGIWKDEPVFGCYLEQVCGTEFPRVPIFVQRCIQCIEQSEENMKTDGLYRASGNLSQVQKIRLHVDQNNYSVLEQEEDVHVLTGALKLFFRELKQPLLPYHFFNKALKASTNHNRKEKLKDFREIEKALPMPNHDTLKFLLQHLLRVNKYQEFNRMHIPNLAIVFGPTLMWSEQESLNMAFDLMQQNLVIECFLAEFDQIFR
uniref:Rho GTPase-activating protein 12 n=1 Tax=Clastoptera arizonana TaxID=38151 RepID=A0A1B6CGE0_9HEMI